MLVYIFFGIVYLCSFTNEVKFPEGIKLCHKSSPDFNECVAREFTNGLKVFADGNRALLIPKLEPFYIKEFYIESISSSNLNQHYYDVFMFGVTNSTVQNFSTEETDDSLKLKFNTISEYVGIDADYEIKGQVIIFPINAKGKCHITIRNELAHHEIDTNKITKKGKVYMNLTNYSYRVISLDSVNYNFSNIVPGNDQLSKEIVQTLNDNSKAIFNDIKLGLEKTLSLVYKTTTSNVFRKVPLDDMFLA